MARRREPGSADSELEALRARYRRELPGKIGAVEQAAAALREGAPATELETLYLHTHRLRGSAAIYGLIEVSEVAARLELFVASAAEAGAPVSAPWLESLREQVTALTQSAGREHG